MFPMCYIDQPIVINEAGYTEPNEKGEIFYYPQQGGLGGLVNVVGYRNMPVGSNKQEK